MEQVLSSATMISKTNAANEKNHTESSMATPSAPCSIREHDETSVNPSGHDGSVSKQQSGESVPTAAPASDDNDGSDSRASSSTAMVSGAGGAPATSNGSGSPSKKAKSKKRNNRNGSKRLSSGADGAGNKDNAKVSMADQYSTRNLYIRGLVPETTNHTLHEMFESFGKIISTKAVASKDRPHECRGYGFVMFESANNARAAVDTLGKQGVSVQFAKISPRSHYSRREDPTNLYFSNLPLYYDETHLQNLLAPFGKVISCRILRDYSSQASRGVGFARMESQAQCESIVAALGGAKLEDSPEPLLCKFADSPQQRNVGGGGGDYRGGNNGLLSPGGMRFVHNAPGASGPGFVFGYDHQQVSAMPGQMTPWTLMPTTASPFSPGGGEYRDVSLYDYSGLNTGAPVQYTDVHGRSVYMTSAPPHVLRSPRGGTAAPLHTRTYVTPSGGGDGPAISSGHLASHLLGGGGAPLTGSYVTSNNGQPMLFSVPADGIMGPASPGGMSGSMPAGAERGGGFAPGGYTIAPMSTQFMPALAPGGSATYGNAPGMLVPGQYFQVPVETDPAEPSSHATPPTTVPTTENVQDNDGQ